MGHKLHELNVESKVVTKGVARHVVVVVCHVRK